MDAADLARLTPQDGIVTLRSLPRRFRAALRPVADDDLDEFVERIGAAGRSPMDHLVDAGRSLTLLQHAFEQVQHHDRPVVPPAAIDPSARDWPAVHGSLDDELTQLADTATAFAAVADRVPAADWGRTGTVAGSDAEMDALDLLREAVRTAITDLRAATQVLDEVRR